MAAAPLSGHVSAVRLQAWFIACRSDELGDRAPLARTIQDLPIVLFRAEGKPCALLDRCPHRNVPLSLGRIEGTSLRCAYHGWRFDGAGVCREIPGSCAVIEDVKARRASAFATRELDGYVWVWSAADAEPKGEPFRFPLLTGKGYATVRRDFRVMSTMHAAIENALDVPHTAFLHGGLFRTSKKESVIDVIVRRGPDRVEAEFIGEPRPPGLAGRILAPGGGVVTHFDRFLLPSVAQIEYRLGPKSHLLTTTSMTPISDLETHLYAMIAFKLPLPSWLVRLVLTPVGLRIFGQDAVILAKQTESIRRFGGEQFANTEIDVLGQQIWRLLKQAERGDAPVSEAEVRLKMRV